MRVEDCKTCRFCEKVLPPFDFECARYPVRTALPGWCSEWQADAAKLCSAKKLWLKGTAGVKIGPLPFPGMPPAFNHCLLAKGHEDDHTDGWKRWPDSESYVEEARKEKPDAENAN